MKKIEDQYTKLSDIEHCLLRPGRYIGSISNHTGDSWVVRNGSMKFETITYNPAMLKLFDEILSNSVDESKRVGSKLDSIHIYYSTSTGELSVSDNGGIPVVIHKDENQYVPEMIFSELRAGSNFDDSVDSFETGQNGEGVKLANIFSKSFKVETADGKNKFVQTFTENMSVRTTPKITKSSTKGTTITWTPDYIRFGCFLKGGNEEKLIKRVHDVAACNPRLKIFLNGQRVKYVSFRSYVSKYMETDQEFVYDQNENWQIGLSSSTEGFQQVSFVNTTETFSGGTHVDYIEAQITKKIREFIKKKHKIDVKPAAIKTHLMVFINAKINNPRYPSQTKECLITESRDFGTSYEVSDKFIDQVLSSSIIQSVLDWVDSKKRQEELAKLRKASRENKNKKVPTHIKANSTRNNVLHICEGLSALGTFLQVRDKNKHGAFPLKGKPLNWRNAKSMVDVAKNAEISSIMSILGLEFGKKAENLNYTKIRYMTDADLDGAGSIVGLLNNFFSLWPELFESGVIEILKSPIVILYKKGLPTVYFYDISEFRKESSKYTDYTLKYVKGLGGLTEQEYDDMINKPMVSRVVLDDDGLDSLEMAFGADADRRKKWLLN